MPCVKEKCWRLELKELLKNNSKISKLVLGDAPDTC